MIIIPNENWKYLLEKMKKVNTEILEAHTSLVCLQTIMGAYSAKKRKLSEKDLEEKGVRCGCIDFKKSSEQLDNAILFSTLHGFEYTGVSPVFCGWCGKKLEEYYL